MSTAGIHVVVVDDEAALLRLMTGYLSRLGYSVCGCGTAAEAVELFARGSLDHSVAVVDLSLPDRQGNELAAELLGTYPELRVILCSGYPITADLFPQHMRQRVGVLQKPFIPNMLVREIERLSGS
jgi:DNA-binding NtrC family response regulator